MIYTEEFEPFYPDEIVDEITDTNSESCLSIEAERADDITTRALKKLQTQINMATIEEFMFENAIEENKKKQALHYSEIKDIVIKAEDQFDKMKGIIQRFSNCSNENTQNYVDIGLHSRKMNELLAYRSYELSRYFREIMNSSKENTTPFRAQNQDSLGDFLNSIDTSGGAFEHEKYNLINAGLIEEIENLKAEMNSLTKMIEDKKSEISVVKNELHNTRQAIDTNFENKCNEIKFKFRSNIETAQAFLNSLSQAYHAQNKMNFINTVKRIAEAHKID